MSNNTYVQACLEIQVTDEEATWLDRAHAALQRYYADLRGGGEQANEEDIAYVEFVFGREPTDEDLSADFVGFDLYVDGRSGDKANLIIGGEECVNVGLMAQYLSAFLRKFRPEIRIGFTYAVCDDELNPGGFSGGGVVVGSGKFALLDAEGWVHEATLSEDLFKEEG